jgi:hypothetical protein
LLSQRQNLGRALLEKPLHVDSQVAGAAALEQVGSMGRPLLILKSRLIFKARFLGSGGMCIQHVNGNHFVFLLRISQSAGFPNPPHPETASSQI